MPLTLPQRRELDAALREAFPSREEVERLTAFGLERNLNEISGPSHSPPPSST